MTGGMSQIEWLAALEEIKALKARRDYVLDTKDWAAYEALHAADHYSHNDGYEREEGAAHLTAQVRQRLDPIVTVHHSHSPVITFQSPDEATGIWGMEDNLYWKQGDEDHWLHGTGFYHETYGRRDGRWVFTSRRLQRITVRTSPDALVGPHGFGVPEAADGDLAGNGRAAR